MLEDNRRQSRWEGAMWRKPRSVALVVLAVAGASTALAPVGNAQSADTVIDDLKD